MWDTLERIERIHKGSRKAKEMWDTIERIHKGARSTWLDTIHITTCNILMKNMNPLCCPWLLVYAAHNFYSIQPIFNLYIPHITIRNIFLKNMDPLCCLSLLLYAAPICFLHLPVHYLQHINEKHGLILPPITFTLCSPCLIYTPQHHYLYHFLEKHGSILLHMSFTLCNPYFFSTPTSSLFATY